MIFVNVLGAPLVRRADGPVTGRAAHRRRLALIAILAAARGRPVGRERIIGLLWPDNPADAARHTLSEGLYVLRKELGEEAFVVVGDEVGLDSARVRCDLDEFERAVDEGRWEDAVKAYGGPFLDGFYVTDAPEFERWAEGERDRLARTYGRALEELALAAEARAAPLQAAEWWRRLLAHDAFSSRIALRLVRVLERAGERAAALRAAEAHVLLLRQELDVGPDPELAALMEDLRAEPPAAPPRLAAASPSGPAGSGDATAVDEDALAALPSGSVGTAAAEGMRVDGERAGERRGSVMETRPVRPRRRMGVRAVALLGTLVAALVTVALAARRNDGAPAEPEYDPHRIAVLYLDDDSPGGELQYLANGLTEMLIHELSQVEALDVISRNGVKPFRQGDVPLDSIVKRLRVGSIVEGSVARSADSVRVVVQLIDANTQAHLDSRVIVRPMGDLLSLQRAVSEEVSASLRRQLGEQARLRQARGETRSAEALDLVLRGEQVVAEAQVLRLGADPADVASAMRMLEDADHLFARAEAADPGWSRPTLGRAWVAVRRASWSPPGTVHQMALDSAIARATRVLRREPRNARALEVRGAAFWEAALVPGAEGDSLLRRAEQDLNAAVAAEPRLASAWGKLSSVLNTRGDLARSELAARRALEHDAWLDLDRVLLQRQFYALVATENYGAAAETCAQAHRALPRDWRFVECRLTLMRVDGSPPDPALAWRLVSQLEAMDPPATAAAAGRAYAPVYRRLSAAAVSARAGDTQRARTELARARVDAAQDSESRVAVAYDEAWVLLMLGDTLQARMRLQVYLDQRPALRERMARDPLVRALTGGAADR